MINQISQTGSFTPPQKNDAAILGADIPSADVKDEYLPDCYQKLSERDVPRMKGDWGPRLQKTYKRWDKDLKTWDVREKGSLRMKRRDTKCKSLIKTYKEFAEFPLNVTLGALRSVYGVLGITALRHAIREQGVIIPSNFK